MRKTEQKLRSFTCSTKNRFLCTYYLVRTFDGIFVAFSEILLSGTALNPPSQQRGSNVFRVVYFSRWRNSKEFRRICLFILDSTQEIRVPGDSRETNQIYRHVLIYALRCWRHCQNPMHVLLPPCFCENVCSRGNQTLIGNFPTVRK